MAVISEIPTEVLTDIFYLLCKSSILVCDLDNSYHTWDFPWTVGLVCRQWRTAFLSYPPIWASLKLSEDYCEPSRSESYAKEINRRLALYLERSREHPLRLDISIQSNCNKTITMVALEMLSACSHRWQIAKFALFCDDWRFDSMLSCKSKLPTLECLEIACAVAHERVWGIFEVAPRLTHAYIGSWAKSPGLILPWTQLTKLTLTIDGMYSDEVLNLLLMLHNIKEFRVHSRIAYAVMDLRGGFPEVVPTLLNQLRVLEVPHPSILSWFKAPSLCEIYFTDYEYSHEPFDVHGQISSLIQRSSCRIRKLSFKLRRNFYVGMLKDVEELVIDCQWACPPFDISSLPNLRLLTVRCFIWQDFVSLTNALTMALESARVPTRSECSSDTLTGTSLLEHVTIELPEPQEIPKSFQEIADKWPVVGFRLWGWRRSCIKR